MKKDKSLPRKIFIIRCYCTDCGALIHESNPLTKKELMKMWDSAVLGAPLVPCKCSPHRCPNFHIALKIWHTELQKEFTPEQILPKPANTPDLELPEVVEAAVKDSLTK